MVRDIQSAQNSWFKQFKHLIHNNRARKKEGIVVVEGLKEIQMALSSAYTLKYLVYCEQILSNQELSKELGSIQLDNVDFYNLSPVLYKEVAYREDTLSAMAIFDLPKQEISLQELDPNGFYLVAESIEKPGNLGAIFRTAESICLTAIILCDERIDRFHPNVTRNSLGSNLLVPCISATADEIIEVFKRLNISIYTTFMDEAVSMYQANMKSGAAIVVGTEHEGLSDVWRDVGQNITIPMQGKMDSLNVSVASAVLMYEAFRQRNALG
jgi:TrmH family RNA methyltransferase